MRGNRRRDTSPELELRSLLHKAGLRFRVDRPIDLGTTRVRPDIVFPRQKVAIFVDGCFWHSCPDHGNMPRVNREYWSAKLGRNSARDREVVQLLNLEGWHVLRFWEHEAPDRARQHVLLALTKNRLEGA
jgi:DNA mismatch endonuclease, patch repair protein